MKFVKIPHINEYVEKLLPYVTTLASKEIDWDRIYNKNEVSKLPRNVLVLPKELLDTEKFAQVGMVKLYFVNEALFGEIMKILPKTLDAFVFSDMDSSPGKGWTNIQTIFNTKDVYVYVFMEHK